jgi:hypothetical protein
MPCEANLVHRVDRLEREVRRTRRWLWSVLGVATLSGVTAWRVPDVAPQIIRARALIIEDEKGRDRIVMGSPVPDPKEGKRISPSTGLVINDTAGFERFGLGLRANGSVGMGFDAPPGQGDDRNRERINIVADERGGALIRMLDRKTWVRARLRLDDENRVALEFLDFPPGEAITRRITIDSDSVVRRARP